MNNSYMKILLLLCGLALGSGLMAEPQSIDKVVAVVDDDVILQSEFDRRMAQVKQQLQERNLPSPPAAALRKQVLDQLILEHLQMQMADRGGVRIDDNTLNQAMANIAQQNNMSFEQFRQVLDANNLYRSTREQLQKELTINQLQNRAVNRRIDITRQEIENYLRSEAGAATIAPEYHVAHLLIPISNDAADAQRRQELARAIHKQLSEGKVDILQISSLGNVAGVPVSGGDLGWRKAENLPTLFIDVVPRLEPGNIAEPFTSANGFHIVQLLETRGGASLTLDQTHLRHILIAPNEIRTNAQAEQLANELYERIQGGEDFADIARKYSDDAKSMVAGGDLDWVSPGQVPQDFMAAVNNTEIGVITKPFRVQTGWHIVEVLERRKQDVTEENKRYQAQQILRQRKYDMELENWLTEIRDTAFIDIKESSE
ncbi:MAG: peptidylprolyl isomerase [Pseudomonadales bacterium]|nr:peptidylprolyl isomerase [Pseudomonadales bacterium]